MDSASHAFYSSPFSRLQSLHLLISYGTLQMVGLWNISLILLNCSVENVAAGLSCVLSVCLRNCVYLLVFHHRQTNSLIGSSAVWSNHVNPKSRRPVLHIQVILTFQILFYTIYTMFLTSKSKHILNAGHHLTICFPLWMTVCSLIAKKCSNEASTSENTLRSLLCPEKKS